MPISQNRSRHRIDIAEGIAIALAASVALLAAVRADALVHWPRVDALAMSDEIPSAESDDFAAILADMKLHD